MFFNGCCKCPVAIRSSVIMRFGEYLKTSCRESSVHGLSYLVKRDLHWTERVFWLLAVLYALYTSINICWDQWLRFRDNPIIYSVESRYGLKNIPIPAILICPDNGIDYEMEETINHFWNVTTDETEKFDYYMKFLVVLTNLRYDNLETMEPYVQDETIVRENFLDILMLMHEEFLESSESVLPGYAPALTDLGLCVTTAQVTKYLNPYGTLQPFNLEPATKSNIFEEVTVSFSLSVSCELHAYLFDPIDIVLSISKSSSTIPIELEREDSLMIDIVISYTGADAGVRALPIAYRKCLYPDENQLKYFPEEEYRPGFCYMECRVLAAIRLCNCRPFFYVIDPEVPQCDLKGLMCLHANKWASTQCKCFPLCEEYRYTPMLKAAQTVAEVSFVRSIMMTSTVSKMIMLRKVVFSTDQLIVGFGGAVGLFLGASFISIYGFLWVFLKFVCSNIRAYWQRRCQAKPLKVLNVKAV